MSDDSLDGFVLERVNSTERIMEKPKFSAVPSDISFIFKLKNTEGRPYEFFEYILSGGKKLPYITVLKGIYLVHNCHDIMIQILFRENVSIQRIPRAFC